MSWDSTRSFTEMHRGEGNKLVTLDVSRPIWDRFFGVFPLVIVGTKEEDGQYDLAPKHLAIPLGWENNFCFVCSPLHATYRNIRREGAFTVSYPRPTEVLLASLAASPRCEDKSKPALLLLPTFPARRVDGVLVEGSYLFLECTLREILDGFGANSLIIGSVMAAMTDENCLRAEDRDEADQIFQSPLLAYLSPGRFAEIRQSWSFPFPKGFSR